MKINIFKIASEVDVTSSNKFEMYSLGTSINHYDQPNTGRFSIRYRIGSFMLYIDSFHIQMFLTDKLLSSTLASFIDVLIDSGIAKEESNRFYSNVIKAGRDIRFGFSSDIHYINQQDLVNREGKYGLYIYTVTDKGRLYSLTIENYDNR